jgi:hypothetical protein
MVRKFLYAIAFLTVVFLLGRLALTFWSGDLAKMALVPSGGFTPPPALATNAWDSPALWRSRPGMANDPARLKPFGLAANGAALPAAVFFVHSTSYMDRAKWNAAVDEPAAEQMGTQVTALMASAFNASPQLWAPRYRQATFGAFLTDQPDGARALDLAYSDVRSAFAAFLKAVPANMPIVLAGHSQGAYHLKRLLADEVAGKPLARRIAATYVVGWPVSLSHDLPLMGLPACASAGQPGCVVSWQSYAEPADPRFTLDGYARFPALDGKSPAGSPFLCVNPLTGAPGTAAPASANAGSLLPDATGTAGQLIPGTVPARCGANGLLLIGNPPVMGPYVLPGNNYHVYDIPLFWANLRADVAARVAAWQAAR